MKFGRFGRAWVVACAFVCAAIILPCSAYSCAKWNRRNEQNNLAPRIERPGWQCQPKKLPADERRSHCKRFLRVYDASPISDGHLAGLYLGAAFDDCVVHGARNRAVGAGAWRRGPGFRAGCDSPRNWLWMRIERVGLYGFEGVRAPTLRPALGDRVCVLLHRLRRWASHANDHAAMVWRQKRASWSGGNDPRRHEFALAFEAAGFSLRIPHSCSQDTERLMSWTEVARMEDLADQPKCVFVKGGPRGAVSGR